MPFRDFSRRADAALYDPRLQDSLITTAGDALIKPLRKLPRLGRGTGIFIGQLRSLPVPSRTSL